MTQHEEWATIDAFPHYEASTQGRIRNRKTERIMQTSLNQYGVLGVKLMKDGRQFHRSVPLLVAATYIPKQNPGFDTPINLDGDRHNNAVSNLMWRPRWHAVAYHQQFAHPYHSPILYKIVDRQTGAVYENSWHCAVTNGLLEEDIVLSIINRTYAGITFQDFAVLA
jgi:NUMOD4 motif